MQRMVKSSYNRVQTTNLCIKVSLLRMWRPASNAAHTVWVRVIFCDFKELNSNANNDVTLGYESVIPVSRIWLVLAACHTQFILQGLTSAEDHSQLQLRHLLVPRVLLSLAPQGLSPSPPSMPASNFTGAHCIQFGLYSGGPIVFLSQLNFKDTDALSAEICWGSKCFHLKWKVF